MAKSTCVDKQGNKSSSILHTQFENPIVYEVFCLKQRNSYLTNKFKLTQKH